jgi:iron complex outermembrane receptor protein
LVQAKFPPVEPDKLTNYEFGVKGDIFQQFLSYTAAIYYIHWTGVQQAITDTLPDGAGLIVEENAQSASGPGAEASLSARPLKGLDVSATVSWTNLTFDHTVYSGGSPIFLQGNRPNLSPPVTASASVSYTFPFGASGTHGQFLFSENYTAVLDNIYILPGGASNYPSNSVVIARAQFTLMPSEQWAISLFADNLMNYNGVITGQDPAYFDIRTTPRTVGMRFDYHLR